MIGFLRGKLAGFTSDGCLLEVGGVGYRLSCSATTLRSLTSNGDDVRLWTYLHVREDALSLFGFSTEAEQTTFEALLSVSGVGPKVALQVCSALAPEALRRALVTDDVNLIASVQGIGKKTAQRIVIDLKERLALPDLEVAGESNDTLVKARSALENLGYSPVEIRQALAAVNGEASAPVEDLVKSALKVLAS